MNDKREKKVLAQRIKYAMAHLSRKQHISLLARPNWRRIQRTDMNIVLDPNAIPRAALKCRPSKRIKVMAQPKHVTKKYDPARAPPPFPRIHPKTLAAKSSRRIMDLALPKKRILLSTQRMVATNKTMSRTVTNLLARLRRSRYQRYRVLCNAVQRRRAAREQKLMARLRKALASPQDWQRHMQFLERIAAPKVLPRPKPPDRRKKWRPVDMSRLENLSMPVSREVPEMRDPFRVPKAALGYKITKRMRELAYEKNLPEILPPRVPGVVPRGALRAIASPRTIDLARPTVRPTGRETDLREDAFTVSPLALKARCSRRLKVLAKPKVYRR